MKVTRINLDALRTHKEVWVPLPPSTNHLYITRGKSRPKSPAYREWLDKAVPIFQTMWKAPTPANATIIFFGPLNEGRDGDNMIKPILDAAVLAGVIPNDNLHHLHECKWCYRPAKNTLEEGLALVSFTEVKP